MKLAELPTPVEFLEVVPGAPALWVKRDDLTSSRYGGNKVRTLEVLFGLAKRAGATHAISTGAFGSNHAVATAVHAPVAGLRSGALLFPQPISGTAVENLRVIAATADQVTSVPHWSALPVGMALLAWRERRIGHRPFIMAPGGATPMGALGYVSAALEIAGQVERGELPIPDAIVVAVGSTCTSAGLLLGLSLAAAEGAFRSSAGRVQPRLVSVRVTPWPITSRARIASLAHRTSRLLAEITADPSVLRSARQLAAHLTVDGRYLGRGYGHETPSGRAAMDVFRTSGGPPLDTTYSAKAAACALDRLAAARGPLLYWATKSSAGLPAFDVQRERALPPGMRRYLERAGAGR